MICVSAVCVIKVPPAFVQKMIINIINVILYICIRFRVQLGISTPPPHPLPRPTAGAAASSSPAVGDRAHTQKSPRREAGEARYDDTSATLPPLRRGAIPIHRNQRLSATAIQCFLLSRFESARSYVSRARNANSNNNRRNSVSLEYILYRCRVRRSGRGKKNVVGHNHLETCSF